MRPCPEDVRAAMRWREEKARKVFAVGRRKGIQGEIAYKCSHCGGWIGPKPQAPNNIISHGLHEACGEEILEEADA